MIRSCLCYTVRRHKILYTFTFSNSVPLGGILVYSAAGMCSKKGGGALLAAMIIK
jgi:hypothetical protein